MKNIGTSLYECEIEKLFFLFLNQNSTVCCEWDGSFKHPKQMFKLDSYEKTVECYALPMNVHMQMSYQYASTIRYHYP